MIESYVVVLCMLVKMCKFEGLEEEMIWDRFVFGIRGNYIWKKLL